jgi:hypothetical protein
VSGNDLIAVVALIIVVVVALVGTLFIKQFLLRRAVSQVALIFRALDAVDPARAKTADQLGFRQRGMVERMMQGRRDYKPQALDAMLQAGIVCALEDNKLYLVEEKLAQFKM